MTPKKTTSPRRRPATALPAVKAPRRPVGVQTLGTLGYARLRQALHHLAQVDLAARESA